MTFLANAWSHIWPILAALLFFGLIIMTHELGHFLAAKLFKVKVNEFSVGMGPAIFKKKKKETQYSIRLLPVGGYVAMEGEEESSDDPNAFNNKPAWKRGIILLAGAFVNLLTGVIIMAVILGSSDLIGVPQIAGFQEGANPSSYSQGLRKGDRIIAVNDQRVYTEYDLSYYMMRDPDGVMDFVVKRGGQEKVLRSIKYQQKEIEGQSTVIFDFAIVGVKPTFGNVAKYAFLDSASVARIVWDSLIDLVTMNYKVSELSGPVGTVDIMAKTATKAVETTNYTSLLTILAFIAINVGVFNLIPFPALDGGQFVFVIIEGIIRKPLSQKFKSSVNAAGLFLLFSLMAVVTVSDIMKLIHH